MKLGARRVRACARAGAFLAPLLATAGVATARPTVPAQIPPSAAPSVAAAVLLNPADLPGFAVEANPLTSASLRRTAQLSRCTGGVSSTAALARSQSPSFVGPGTPAPTVTSSDAVYPSAAFVARNRRAISGRRALTCLIREFNAELRSSLPPGEQASTHAARIGSPATGVDGTFAIRLSFLVTIPKVTGTTTVPLYVDLIGFSYGQVAVNLSLMSTFTPPPAAIEQALTRTLVDRLHQAVA